MPKLGTRKVETRSRTLERSPPNGQQTATIEYMTAQEEETNPGRSSIDAVKELEEQADTGATAAVEGSSEPEHHHRGGGGWCKKYSRWIFATICVLVIVVVVVVVAVAVSGDNDEEHFPYEDIVNELNLSPNSTDEDIIRAIHDMNEHYRTRCKAGSVVAVTRNGNRVIVPQGVMKIAGETDAITEDTLFEIGSISKPLSGLLLAQQIVNGLVNLTTPLNDHLPDMIPDLLVNDEKVTFGQLVTHTAGFPRLSKNVRDRSFDLLKDNPYAGYTEADMLEQIRIAAANGLSQKGNVEYSNFGFNILGYLLAKNRNTTFPELQKSLTDILGMTSTFAGTLQGDESARSRLSTGYIGTSPAPYWYDGGYFIDGAGSTLSSASDLCQLVEALMSPDSFIADDDSSLVDALNLSLTAIQEQTPRSGVAFSWFYGNRNQTENLTWYTHNGGTAGFRAYAAFQPGTQTGVVAATNCGEVDDLVFMGEALASKLLVL